MRTFSILAAALVLAAGCSTNSSMSSGMGAMPGMMSSTDIAAIMTAANEGEIQEGQAAASRATSASVRDFANMMVSDHTSALNSAKSLFDREHIVANSDNDIARQLRSGAQQTISALGTYNGASFDRAYMQSQVDAHQWLLTQLDNTFIPSSRGELRSLLETQRATVAAHLDRARTIMGRM
jgi:putative membrane protein